MTPQERIEKTKEFVKTKLSGETTGHDYWHSILVWRNVQNIAKTEDVDAETVELAALLHDIGDWKLNKGMRTEDEEIEQFLESMGIEKEKSAHILQIIKDISFSNSKGKTTELTPEGKVVQDADRLEALGAIGIARTFSTGQKLGQEIYNPDTKPNLNMDEEEYKKQYTGERKNTTINHFYEKLLLLKDLMNTKTGKAIAEKRHKVMEEFLEEFYAEWDGKR